jgi:tRNA pseudouridine55 synthase
MTGDLAGLLLVDKPAGPTSHDVVSALRQTLGVRRVGHTGTLDPFASGLLLLCVGWATRLAQYLTSLPKIYRGVIRLGVSTDTDDRTGSIIGTNSDWQTLDRHRVQAALEEQLGVIEQVPPAYSAKKVAGRRAYAVARQGGAPQLAARQVTIRRASIFDFAPPDVSIELECSSGTYVRAVARDLGASLGVGAHLAALRRLRVGPFRVEDAVGLSPNSHREDVIERLLPPEAAVAHLERVDLDGASVGDLVHGRPVVWQGTLRGPLAAHHEGRLVAVTDARDGQLWPLKVFPSGGEPRGSVE